MNNADRVIMERPNLEGIPSFEPPESYRIRPYKSGDEAHWYDIHLEADKISDITEDLFAREFGSDPDELAQRQFYLCHGEKIIGTAAAWHGRDYKDGSYGRVHWVAIRLSYQGRGLSKPLMRKVLSALRELGYEKAYLTTSRRRPVAIRLYQSFGFVEV